MFFFLFPRTFVCLCVGLTVRLHTLVRVFEITVLKLGLLLKRHHTNICSSDRSGFCSQIFERH